MVSVPLYAQDTGSCALKGWLIYKRVKSEWPPITIKLFCLTISRRYVNMDYVFLSSLMGIAVACVLISYDIACQWSRNLAKRVKAFPPTMQEAFLRILLLFAVPKFHLPAHGGKCQSPYALGLIKGAGRVDGEGIERGWSLMNAIATATREMGPGFRHDTMDDHWQSLNWRKIVGLGEY